jgi:hypothetical protein
MKPFSLCPLTGRQCAEERCAWWLVMNNQGGCAVRALGALVQKRE